MSDGRCSWCGGAVDGADGEALDALLGGRTFIWCSTEHFSAWRAGAAKAWHLRALGEPGVLVHRRPG